MTKNRKTQTTTPDFDALPELAPLQGEIVERRHPSLPDFPDYRLPRAVPYGDTLLLRLRYHGMTEALGACERLMRQASRLNEAAEEFKRSAIKYERESNRFDQLDAILADDRDALEYQLRTNKLRRQAEYFDYVEELAEKRRAALPSPPPKSPAEVYAECHRNYLTECQALSEHTKKLREEFAGDIDEKVLEDYDQMVRNSFNFLKNHSFFSQQSPPSDPTDNITPIKPRRN